MVNVMLKQCHLLLSLIAEEKFTKALKIIIRLWVKVLTKRNVSNFPQKFSSLTLPKIKFLWHFLSWKLHPSSLSSPFTVEIYLQKIPSTINHQYSSHSLILSYLIFSPNCIPLLDLSTMFRTGFTVSPNGRSSKFLTILAKILLISSIANFCPIQFLGPAEKGTYA